MYSSGGELQRSAQERCLDPSAVVSRLVGALPILVLRLYHNLRDYKEKTTTTTTRTESFILLEHRNLDILREPPLLGQADVKLFEIIPNFQISQYNREITLILTKTINGKAWLSNFQRGAILVFMTCYRSRYCLEASKQ